MDQFTGSVPPSSGGWFADPAGRHQQRYWNGAAWTEHVADNGVQGIDPLTGPSPQPMMQPQPTTAPYVPPVSPATTGAWPVPATAGAGRQTRRYVGGAIGAVGGAGMIVGTYLHWLGSDFFALSGWDIYRVRSLAGENVFVVPHMYKDTVISPMFTGLTTLILGILLIAMALLVVVLPETRRPDGSPGKYAITRAVALPAGIIASLALSLPVLNVFFWVVYGRNAGADAQPGFFIVLAAGLAGAIGLNRAMRRRTVRMG